jgi:hypothetical protein
MNNYMNFYYPSRLTPMAAKVASILVRDGGITHLSAVHYGIGSVTKEIARIRKAVPMSHKVSTVTRKDAAGNKYTRWTVRAI